MSDSPAQDALDAGRVPGAVGAVARRTRLTDRQARYVEARGDGKSQIEAALCAGLTPSHARQTASKWESDDVIADALDAGRVPGAVGAVARRTRLTDRQARYVEARGDGKSQIEAALYAGLTPSHARQTASKWEQDEVIADAIGEAQKAHGIEAKVSPADVIRELAIVAFSSLDDYAWDEHGIEPDPDAPAHVMRAVQSVKKRVKYERQGEESVPVVTWEFKLWDKMGALRMLGDYLGMWIKRIRVEDDDEAKATLLAMRRVMDRVAIRAESHRAEEAAIARFQQAELAEAGAVVASSARPMETLKALSRRIDAALGEQPGGPGGSDADA